MFELHDKVALITGAAGGLGDKIARTLHKQGATLALTDMRAEPMEKLKAELEKSENQWLEIEMLRESIGA